MPRQRKSRRDNPSGSDLALLAGLGLLGVAGFQMAQQVKLPNPLQELFHSVFPEAVPPAPSFEPCFNVRPGNTKITLRVQPWNPPGQVGAPVAYVGQLTTSLLGVGMSGKSIEFYDPSNCAAGPFGTAETDQDGYFQLTRPLQANEVDGYTVYALFRGEIPMLPVLIGRIDAAQSGVWQVKPQ